MRTPHNIQKEILETKYINEGKTSKAIATEFGVSKSIILSYLHKYNIPIKSSNKLGHDLTNKKKFKLTYLYPINKSRADGSRYWKCQCECGNFTEVSSGDFIRTRSCGCLKKIKGSFHRKWTGFGEISGSFWNKILYTSSKRGLELNITQEYIWNLFLLQNRKCALSGLDLVIQDRNGTASLDRIDSSKGYLIDNVQWLHRKVNYMKQNLPEKEFLELCILIIQNKTLTETITPNGIQA